MNERRVLGSRIPEPGAPVLAEAEEPGSVRAELRVPDRTAVTDPGDFLARGRIP